MADRTARAPRVLVVGPIAGGSLETAHSTARACRSAGAETRFLDFGGFGGGLDTLSRLPVNAANRARFKGELARVLGETAIAAAAEWRPDLVLALAQAPLNASVCARLRGAGIRTAFWFVENHRVLTYWQQVAGDYDVFFAIQDEPFLTRVREAGAAKAVYLPTACDPERHLPIALTDEERRRFGADISFAGTPYLNRQRILLGLMDFDLRIWGEGWAGTELARFAAESGARFNLAEMVRIFSATKINLNIHSANHVDGLDPNPDYVNPRTFELASCGAFQLVDARQPLPSLFDEDEIVTFRSSGELRKLIAHYLAREDERADVAGRARARALAAHTFEHRVRRIFAETLPPELSAAAGQPVHRDLLESIQALERTSPKMTGDEAMMRVLQNVRTASL